MKTSERFPGLKLRPCSPPTILPRQMLGTKVVLPWPGKMRDKLQIAGIPVCGHKKPAHT